jgi:aquaporin Z
MIKYIVEFIGTLLLVFVILATGNWIAIGAILGIGVLIGGPISGGAYNPAVAIALNNADKLSNCDLLIYIIVEILGGVTALLVYNQYIKK